MNTLKQQNFAHMYVYLFPLIPLCHHLILKHHRVSLLTMSSGMRRFSYQILLQLQRTHLSPMLLVISPFSPLFYF
jgi:hypothetical protein